MSRPRSAAAELQELEALTSVPDVQIVVGPLKRVLAGRSSATLAKAAILAAKFQVREVEPELKAAFEHFLGKGAGNDPLCSAKVAIVKALRALGADDGGLYLRGMQHYWPARPRAGQRDQAASLRIVSAEALAEAGCLDLLTHLTDLLGDPTPAVRVAAALALGSTGERNAALPLRLKALSGDEASEVLEACFTALLNLDATTAVSFLGRFLDADEERSSLTAALALGQSEHPNALDLLAGRWKRQLTNESRSDLLVAIALLRYPRAVDFLCAIIGEGGDDAEDAIHALAAFKTDLQIRRRVESAIERTDDDSLRRCFEASFR